MSEELLQATSPRQVGKYLYHRLGNATLEQLKNHGLVPRKNYGKLKIKKPDGLVTYHGAVKAVVEYKPPVQLKSEKQVGEAINQELAVAKALCKLLIVTDGTTRSYWVNALNGERISDQNGHELRTLFHPFGSGDTTTIEHLIEDIDASISATRSRIRSPTLIDPTPLAQRLWQTIWVATGKSPVKCLYNVVELFIFKFLSDLRILPEDLAFDKVYTKSQDNQEDALDYYARNSRTRIYKLFPMGDDGTTIINGTIFVTESNEPNLSQAILFQRCLEHLNRHTEEFGNLTKISKQFKTKLYESFLKQEVEALGQYFTPRRVIQSMIRMARIDQPSFTFQGKRICDPFCGVGGFLVEMMNLNDRMMAAYSPASDGSITPPFVMHGFDKGFERDDERTIILAKANMLIYLAEILFRNPQSATAFATVFNDTFTMFRNNLGTFGHIIADEGEKYDIVMTNPPYVTSGSSIIKEEIAQTPHTASEYPINGLGLESLSLEWIVKSLKRGGRAYVIIPDGILARVHGKKLRDHILHECFLDAIISLPMRTFFANFERTYVLAVTKKHDRSEEQTHPVFTFLVSHIGERLTSIGREEIDEDDLPDVERLFKVFTATKHDPGAVFEEHPRCKVQPIARFRDAPHWVIDRWWSADEHAMFDDDVLKPVTKAELDISVEGLSSAIAEYDQLKGVITASIAEDQRTRLVSLKDTQLFHTFIGKRILRKDLVPDGSIPVYSANVIVPMGYTDKTRVDGFEFPSVLWGIDGNFAFNVIPAGTPFETTDHCGTIRILNGAIIPEYLLYALHVYRREKSYSRSFRASLTNIRRIQLPIPVTASGSFDVPRQRKTATDYMSLQGKAEEIETLKDRVMEGLGAYLNGSWS